MIEIVILILSFYSLIRFYLVQKKALVQVEKRGRKYKIQTNHIPNNLILHNVFSFDDEKRKLMSLFQGEILCLSNEAPPFQNKCE